MKDLQRQLRDTTLLVKTLSTQLNDLREKVSDLMSNESEIRKAERRREREREGGRGRQREIERQREREIGITISIST